MDTDDLFESLFGASSRRSGRRPQGHGMNSPGEDELYEMEVELKDAALGAERVITLPNGKKLQVKIPAGIESGKKLKLKGLGKPGSGTGPSGDIYVQINVLPMNGFTRIENDIHTDLSISFFEAISGASVEVPTLDGTVMLQVPAGVSSGSKLRVKNKGAGAGENRGKLIVTLKIVMPKNVNPEMKEAISKLQEQFSYNPRSSL